jgi:hypothetical protein
MVHKITHHMKKTTGPFEYVENMKYFETAATNPNLIREEIN